MGVPRDPDFFCSALGAAHRLANGNTFVTDGMSARLFEVTAAKAKVWEASFGPNLVIYGARTAPRSFFTEW